MSTGSHLANSLKLMMGYCEMLTNDIPADRFCEMPHPTMNHPAWIIGHCLIYPDRVLEMMGRSDIAKPVSEDWNELFGFGSECKNDASLYPDKDTLLAAFTDNHGRFLSALEEASDESLASPMPDDHPMKGRFPHVGDTASFLSGAHVAVHLGQLSAWRRAIGLGSVM